MNACAGGFGDGDRTLFNNTGPASPDTEPITVLDEGIVPLAALSTVCCIVGRMFRAGFEISLLEIISEFRERNGPEVLGIVGTLAPERNDPPNISCPLALLDELDPEAEPSALFEIVFASSDIWLNTCSYIGTCGGDTKSEARTRCDGGRFVVTQGRGNDVDVGMNSL